MSNQKQHWSEIIERYKASGLSQPEFCKQNELSCNQFQYRWYQHNLVLKAKTRAAISNNQPSRHLFEPVSKWERPIKVSFYIFILLIIEEFLVPLM
jgi:hypothetical protein